MSDKESEIRQAFRDQARFCRGLGSELTADILDTVAEKIDRSSETGRRLLGWDGDPRSNADNVTLRLAGGLHALARAEKDAALTAAYRGDGPVGPAVEQALIAHDDELVQWLDLPPQTNEVGRAAAVMAGLLVAADRYPLPIDILELGASAGLVLDLNRYRYDLGGVETGEPTSPLLLAPKWQGRAPPASKVDIITQSGVDRSPIYLSTPEAAERLVAYIWPDQPERIDRAEKAIRLARAFTPPVVAGEAADWTEQRLAQPQAEGVLRILYHTIAFQYFPEEQKQRIRAAVEQAAAEASAERPLGWLSLETNPETGAIELRLKLWPAGEGLHLANTHPHLNWVSWLL
ncbi:DUF2332 family protein [Parasphingopyxis sp.]|uniref:DUF2332 domain-containing protein n=1 Tax=Parasphingopyxis sp. TaxID=1920299 RepID=UPI0026240A18|nr:DUF2332 family protein [Parasphingopyxis sp.]